MKSVTEVIGISQKTDHLMLKSGFALKSDRRWFVVCAPGEEFKKPFLEELNKKFKHKVALGTQESQNKGSVLVVEKFDVAEAEGRGDWPRIERAFDTLSGRNEKFAPVFLTSRHMVKRLSKSVDDRFGWVSDPVLLLLPSDEEEKSTFYSNIECQIGTD